MGRGINVKEKPYVQNVGKINEGQPSVKGYRDMHIRLLPIQDPDGFLTPWTPSATSSIWKSHVAGFHCKGF